MADELRRPHMKYDVQYSSCHSTYATLRIFHETLVPGEIDTLFSVNATSSQQRGDPVSIKHPEKGERKLGSWFLESEGRIESEDSRRHIDWLLDQSKGKRHRAGGIEVQRLQD